MKIERFEDVLSWQKAENLTLNVYTLFKDTRDFGFRDQIQRASVSIMNNIAEGFERRTNNELRSFLYIAKGSSGEVRSMLGLAHKLGYLTKQEYDENYTLSVEISKLLSAFIKSIPVSASKLST